MNSPNRLQNFIALSSKGRIADFESVCLGSNPSRASKYIKNLPWTLKGFREIFLLFFTLTISQGIRMSATYRLYLKYPKPYNYFYNIKTERIVDATNNRSSWKYTPKKLNVDNDSNYYILLNTFQSKKYIIKNVYTKLITSLLYDEAPIGNLGSHYLSSPDSDPKNSSADPGDYYVSMCYQYIKIFETHNIEFDCISSLFVLTDVSYKKICQKHFKIFGVQEYSYDSSYILPLINSCPKYDITSPSILYSNRIKVNDTEAEKNFIPLEHLTNKIKRKIIINDV